MHQITRLYGMEKWWHHWTLAYWVTRSYSSRPFLCALATIQRFLVHVWQYKYVWNPFLFYQASWNVINHRIFKMRMWMKPHKVSNTHITAIQCYKSQAEWALSNDSRGKAVLTYCAWLKCSTHVHCDSNTSRVALGLDWTLPPVASAICEQTAVSSSLQKIHRSTC